MKNGNPKLLPISDKLISDAEMLVHEEIQGHRIFSDQEPFMIVLEALAVCADKNVGSEFVSEEVHESFTYKLVHNQKMRFLVFQDWHLENVINDNTIPDTEKWMKWKQEANDQFNPNLRNQFDYLDEPFSKNIHELDHAIQLIKHLELDTVNKRRWTSKFVSVTGRDLIFPDMTNKWTQGRHFFAHGGELVFLMLNRSNFAKENNLKQLIEENFLNSNNLFNMVAKKLADPNEEKYSNANIGYLPLFNHKSYDQLAQDWHAILSLTDLPEGHHFEPIFRITGLNLIVYLAERAKEEAKLQKIEPIIADFMNGTDSQLRDLSKASLNQHRYVANKAIEANIRRRIENCPDWKHALDNNLSKDATQIIKELFKLKSKEIDENRDPNQQLEYFIEKAKNRSKNNTHKFLMSFVRETGIGDNRQGIGTWFNVSDSFILSLVLSNVNNTMELNEFTAKLYEKYRIVIGPIEVRKAFIRTPIDIQKFEANLAAFESRMTKLALTNRLSDDCAFVTNPYRNTKNE